MKTINKIGTVVLTTGVKKGIVNVVGMVKVCSLVLECCWTTGTILYCLSFFIFLLAN